MKPFHSNRMSYNWDNCLHSERWSPTCQEDTQQVGGEHTVQTLRLCAQHRLCSWKMGRQQILYMLTKVNSSNTFAVQVFLFCKCELMEMSEYTWEPSGLYIYCRKYWCCQGKLSPLHTVRYHVFMFNAFQEFYRLFLLPLSINLPCKLLLTRRQSKSEYTGIYYTVRHDMTKPHNMMQFNTAFTLRL